MYIKNPKNAAQTSQDCEWDENVFFIKRSVGTAFLSPLWAHMKDLQM